MMLSAGAHSILGWKAMSERLAATDAPADLVLGLRVGWIWGGPPMIVFGIIAITACVARFHGRPASMLLPSLIALLYLGFAAWAAVVTGGDPFFVLFLVPGLLLAVASIP